MPQSPLLANPIRLLSWSANPRTQLAGLTLVALLQRSPTVFRATQVVRHAIEPATRMAQKALFAAASLGSYHAVSGATTAVYSTNPELPVTLDLGESFRFGFGVTNTMANASSWSVTGEIPPGLIVSGNNDEPLSNNGVFNAQFGIITGIPTQPGSFTLFLKPWRDSNATGPTAEALEASFTIVGPPLVAAPIRVDNSANLFLVYWQADESNQYAIQKTATPDDPQSWTDWELPVQSDGNARSVSIPTTDLSVPIFVRIQSHY